MTQPGRAGARGVIATLGYCGAMVSVTQTVSLPLLPILPDELGTTAGNVSWVATAAVLSGAIANPVMGRLGDMHGKRRMILVSLAVLLAGCVLAATTHQLIVLVIGRAMQGFAIAVLPLGMSIAKDTLPPDKTTSGVALVSATLGIGGGIGLPMAGLIAGWFDWQAVFWFSAALTALAIVLVAVFIPDDTARSGQPFDLVGAVWLSACLVGILLPLSKAASWGWARPLPLAMYAFGFTGLVGWYFYEQRPVRSLVDVRLMGERPMMLVNGAGLLLGFSMFSNMYASLVLLQTPETVAHGFGASIVVAGLVMAPGAIAMMLTSPLSAWLTDHHGARTSLWLGAVVIGVAYATRWPMLGSMWGVGFSVAFVNAGVGLAYGAMPSAIMAFVPASETASANAIGTLTRAGGASISGAMVGAVLTSMTVTVAGDAIPTLDAFHLVFTLSAVAAFIAAGVAWQLPRVAVPSQYVAVARTT
jgi:MFS family permease